MPRGFFLSLDGLDGAGKSTQCRLLAAWLREQGRTVTECPDPGGTELGRAVRAWLLDHRRGMSVVSEALLFMASRAQLVEEIIRPALAAGNVVVSDRFLLANIVYQGHASGLDPARLEQIGQFATGGCLPDLTFILDLPAEAALTRLPATQDRIERRDLEYHRRVRDGFLAEARRQADRIVVVDARQPPEMVQRLLREECGRRMPAS